MDPREALVALKLQRIRTATVGARGRLATLPNQLHAVRTRAAIAAAIVAVERGDHFPAGFGAVSLSGDEAAQR